MSGLTLRQLLLLLASLVAFVVIAYSGSQVAAADDQARTAAVIAFSAVTAILVTAGLFKSGDDVRWYSAGLFRRIILMASQTCGLTLAFIVIAAAATIACAEIGTFSVQEVLVSCSNDLFPGWTDWRASRGVQVLTCNGKSRIWDPVSGKSQTLERIKCYQKSVIDKETHEPINSLPYTTQDPSSRYCSVSAKQVVDVPQPPTNVAAADSTLCSDYQKTAGWAAGCSDDTARGYYWRPDRSFTSKYGNFGLIYEGKAVCDAAHLGDRAAAGLWPPSHSVWNIAAHIFPHAVPGPERGVCPPGSPFPTSQWSANRPVTECPEGYPNTPTCGIYGATCTKIGQ
jgi:hypothetical protein